MASQITVILLTCNRTAYVRQALEGLLNQTFTDWTLKASDCTMEPQARTEIQSILEEYRHRDATHEMQILQQPERIPQGEHLRRALLGVKTPYVALLDDDDIWLPNHLERAFAWLQQSPRHGLAISNGRVIDAQGVKHGWTNSREDPLPASSDQKAWLRLFMTSFFGSTSSYVFRSDALANHTFYSTSMVDIHLALSILLNDYQVTAFTEPSYFYRVHENSSYQKGLQVIKDRNDLRLWLFRQQGLRIIRKFPLFSLFVIKSVISRTLDAVRGCLPPKAPSSG